MGWALIIDEGWALMKDVKLTLSTFQMMYSKLQRAACFKCIVANSFSCQKHISEFELGMDLCCLLFCQLF